MKNKRRRKKFHSRSIITGHLEKIGAKVFDDFSSSITDLIKGHQGIYALFKKDRLYYVGLARNLKSRINAHNRDRHQNKWTHFSLYIIRKEDHIKEIESLVLRIAYPKGNKIKGKLKHSKDIRPLLKRRLKDEWIKQLDGIIGGSKKEKIGGTSRKIKKSKVERPLKGLLRNYQRIYCTYKGKDHSAKVLPNGVVELIPSKKRFDSPSMAGIAVIKKNTVNGWKLWKYKDRNGELVYIDTLRK
jgi:Restriction Enzyme Adenine Methylase Associated/GIY-YIG catalytic domain